MPKGKKKKTEVEESQTEKITPNKKKSKTNKMSNEVSTESEMEDRSPVQEDVDELMSKYMGENQMMWFRTIIRAQATDVMKDIIAQEVQFHMKDLIAKIQRDHEIAIKEVHNMINDLKSDNAKKQRRIERVEFLLQKKNDKINDLIAKVDNMEQKEYVNDIQIVGLEESKSEKDDIKKLLKLSKDKLGVKLKSTDIKCVHRLGKQKPNKHRDLVVSFNESSTREGFYQNRKKTSSNKDPKQNIYINDRITHYRQELFYSARKLCRAQKVFAAWTQRGNVLIRKSENGPVIEIHKHSDLMSIKDKNEMDEDLMLSSSRNSEEVISHLSDYDFSDDDY